MATFWVLNNKLGSGVTDFEYSMFQGAYERDGEFPLDGRPRTVQWKLEHPLKLYRNACRMPQLFNPFAGLVVSDRVRAELGKLPNTHYSRAEFAVLFWRGWEPGVSREEDEDKDLYDEWEKHGMEEWLPVYKKLPHRPDLVAQVGPYWEIVYPQYRLIADKYSGGTRIKVVHPSESDDPDESWFSEEVRISDPLLRDHPFLRTKAGTIIRADVYERLAPYVNLRYFASVRMDVAG